jgi:hypothetical protein
MSNVGLNKLVFDPANAADSANVGAYLRSSDGTLLTHSAVGAKRALDVSIADGVNVEVDLSHVDDSVRLGDGTNFLTSTTVGADIGLDVNLINASIVVTASNLDIRDLTHVSDSVKIGDGTDFLAVNADGSVNTKAAGASSAAYGAVTVTTSATDIVGTDLTNRIQIIVQNIGNKDVYIGSNASVTAANGLLLASGSSMVLDAGAGINVHGITASGSASVRYFELAA